MPAGQVIANKLMVWSTHIDKDVSILRRDPRAAPAAALTHFCSAGYSPLDTATTSPRIDKGKRFICAFHNHTLSDGSKHWTMTWIDVGAAFAVHFDSLWDDQSTSPIAESLQKERQTPRNGGKEGDDGVAGGYLG